MDFNLVEAEEGLDKIPVINVGGNISEHDSFLILKQERPKNRHDLVEEASLASLRMGRREESKLD